MADDDFELAQQTEGAAEGGEPQEHADELDLSQPFLAIPGEDGKEVTLSGQEVIERFSRTEELERQNAELLEKAKLIDTLKPLLEQRPAVAPTVQQERQQQADPMVELEKRGAEALERFANGDLTVVPDLMSIMVTAAREAAKNLWATNGTLTQTTGAALANKGLGCCPNPAALNRTPSPKK